MERIILASESPRRKSLLTQAGIPFEAIPSYIDEKQVVQDEISPYDYVKILSTQKAVHVADSVEGEAIIIAADTIVSYLGEIMGKPSDEEGAFLMLKRLQGREHSVYTGVTIIRKTLDGIELKNIVDNTSVVMRKLSDDEIWAYIATGEPFDKAGGYAIQEKGSLLIEGIGGDYYTVVGLPIVKVYMCLKNMGVNLSSLWGNSVGLKELL